LVALAAATLATVAIAAVTFDPVTGTGFVGKGDVQTAFGWNNQQLQQNADGVGFTFDQSTRYSIVCQWVTGEGTPGEKPHEVTHKRTFQVNSAIAYDTRTRNQITGFNLNGFGSDISPMPVPAEGGSCLGYGAEGTIKSVSVISSEGGLYVTYGGMSVPLMY
jgi:hypothetical protein